MRGWSLILIEIASLNAGSPAVTLTSYLPFLRSILHLAGRHGTLLEVSAFKHHALFTSAGNKIKLSNKGS